MDLQTFNGLVDESSAHDWERVASDGTTYTDAFHPSMSGGSDTINLDVDGA